jgi:valyl-tRNA synthetase
MKEVPFETVYIHALVRDEKGQKMSKSKGNVIDPLELIDQYGADALRFTLTAMAARGATSSSTSRVEGYRNFGTKLWNAARFAEMNGCARAEGFDPKACAQPVNRWIVGEYAHVWGVYCDWYLEFAKPLLQGDDATAKAETQACAAWALDQLLVLMHPIMPFITEELWDQTGPRDAPLPHAEWPSYAAADMADPEADAAMRWTIAAIEAIRSVRAEMNVAPGAQIPLAVVGADDAAARRLAASDALIRRLARLSDVTTAEAAPKGAVTLAVEGATLCLPLADVIDVAAEKARLEKATAKADKEIKGFDAKLSNEKFLAKAPEAVVEEQREKKAAAEAERARLSAALERLAEIG